VHAGAGSSEPGHLAGCHRTGADDEDGHAVDVEGDRVAEPRASLRGF
jgi:hypothetical protein